MGEDFPNTNLESAALPGSFGLSGPTGGIAMASAAERAIDAGLKLSLRMAETNRTCALIAGWPDTSRSKSLSDVCWFGAVFSCY